MTRKQHIESVNNSIVIFENWLKNTDFVSYDIYDYWSSKLGVFSKKLFNKNKLLALPLVSTIQFLDSFFHHQDSYLLIKELFQSPLLSWLQAI